MIEKTQASLYVIVDKKYFYLYKKALWKMSEKFLIFQFTKGTHCRLWFVNIKQPRGPVNQHGMLGFHTATHYCHVYGAMSDKLRVTHYIL